MHLRTDLLYIKKKYRNKIFVKKTKSCKLYLIYNNLYLSNIIINEISNFITNYFS